MSQRKNTARERVRAARRKRGRPLPWILAGAAAVLLLSAALLAWTRANPPAAAIEVTGAPSLKVDRESVDLGDVKLGETVEVAFSLTNVGDRVLKFESAPYIEVVEGC
jgi:cell division septal protein FtsQ